MDGRLKTAHPSKPARPQTHKRQLIFDFLQQLYQMYSEPVPEVNAGNDRMQTQRAGLKLRFRPRKGKRPRITQKRDRPLEACEAQFLRQLPASSYVDWKRLFESKHPDVRVSFKLFLKAP